MLHSGDEHAVPVGLLVEQDSEFSIVFDDGQSIPLTQQPQYPLSSGGEPGLIVAGATVFVFKREIVGVQHGLVSDPDDSSSPDVYENGQRIIDVQAAQHAFTHSTDEEDQGCFDGRKPSVPPLQEDNHQLYQLAQQIMRQLRSIDAEKLEKVPVIFNAEMFSSKHMLVSKKSVLDFISINVDVNSEKNSMSQSSVTIPIQTMKSQEASPIVIEEAENLTKVQSFLITTKDFIGACSVQMKERAEQDSELLGADDLVPFCSQYFKQIAITATDLKLLGLINENLPIAAGEFAYVSTTLQVIIGYLHGQPTNQQAIAVEKTFIELARDQFHMFCEDKLLKKFTQENQQQLIVSLMQKVASVEDFDSFMLIYDQSITEISETAHKSNSPNGFQQVTQVVSKFFDKSPKGYQPTAHEQLINELIDFKTNMLEQWQQQRTETRNSPMNG